MKKNLLVILLAFFVTACGARSPRWDMTSLRAFDPVDFPADPAADITAVYTRNSGLATEIRIDLLDMPFDPAKKEDEQTPLPDLYILLDTALGGSAALTYPRSETATLDFSDLEYDVLVAIPGRGRPAVYVFNEKGLSPAWWYFPSTVIDRVADTLTVRLNRLALPESFSLQVIALNAIQLDRTAIINSNDSIQTRAPLLLAFYNTFPATTPAQTLRRWDGAHTGPLGERHGLKHLLDAAQKFNTPLFLLDLKNTTSLSALDTVGAMKQIQAMQKQGLLILPDNADGEESDILLARNTSTAQAFGLNSSNAYYGSFPPPPNYRYTFISLPDVSLPARAGDVTLIPLPNEDESLQPDRSGLPLNLRSQLLERARNNVDTLLILGGDLPYSTWANWDMAAPALAYLAARPYIQLMDEKSLAASHVQHTIGRPAGRVDIPAYALYNSQGQKLSFASDQLRADLVTALEAAPQNDFTTLAWDMFFALTAPTFDPKLAQLRAQYLSDVYYFIAASQWAEEGNVESTCQADINRDDIQECVVATGSVFAVLVPDGARLLYWFARDAQGLHQIVGPSWQFETGLSDRSAWNLSLGPAADAKAMPGAFVDVEAPWQGYSANISEGVVVFSHASQVKSFRFDGAGVAFTGAAGEVQVALAFDPWVRFVPGWAERYRWGSGGWEVDSGPNCRIQGEGGLKRVAFADSGALMKNPEDPNLVYPGGHFLPFPLAVITHNAEMIELVCFR